MPPPLPCGVHGEAEVICGALGPEDFEVTPDEKYLIVPQMVTGNGGPGSASGLGRLSIFHPTKKSFTQLIPTAEPLKDWGDASCPGPVREGFAPHGMSLVKRSNGKWQLYVVNHGGRESIEMYELRQSGGTWGIVWHGCVISKTAYNDVAALAYGGFVATYPLGMLAANQTRPPFGDPTGFMVRWIPGRGESELPGTRSAYPNGVMATPDGKTAYYAVFRSNEVRRYDLRQQRNTAVVKVDSMPDNLTWTKRGNLLAAGMKGSAGECPPGSGQFCRQAFTVTYIDADKMTQKTAYDSNGKGNLIPSASVAIRFGNSIYVGAYEGDRIVRVNWKE